MIVNNTGNKYKMKTVESKNTWNANVNKLFKKHNNSAISSYIMSYD